MNPVLRALLITLIAAGAILGAVYIGTGGSAGLERQAVHYLEVYWSDDVDGAYSLMSAPFMKDANRQEFEKLRAELEVAGSGVGSLSCVDDWSVKDLLAVRAWWTENVIDWIEAGRRGETPITPAEGYRWNETPRLNADVVKASRRESYRSVRARLERGFKRVMHTIDSLDDRELFEVGVFAWAGNHPIARWVSINTARQYTTARTFIRRALKKHRA